MKELNTMEMELVNGAGVDGVDWGAVGAGIGGVAVGLFIAGTPVGWFGAAGATVITFGGGWSIGRGISEWVISLSAD